ncbi:hypothetical protein GWI33_011431 [Rhynchophorus ferrugineus]|uniref:Uncharacterized protein n=1 Tax=Rhynchophorus ferrugineus TaxID=354439 RepID=A0A834IQE0_RHYFE|nr:hypothetical protein GWI33_011431 [Rhynchophorus ferrugineus]
MLVRLAKVNTQPDNEPEKESVRHPNGSRAGLTPHWSLHLGGNRVKSGPDSVVFFFWTGRFHPGISREKDDE